MLFHSPHLSIYILDALFPFEDFPLAGGYTRKVSIFSKIQKLCLHLITKIDFIHQQEQFREIEELYLTFAKKASAFNSWFENAEEDLTDPVRCNR